LRLKRLSDEDVVKCQHRGYFDEHLATLYSIAYGEPYLYRGKYLVYADLASKTISITLFGLDSESGGDAEKTRCFKDLTSHFKPSRVIVTSPSRLPSHIEDFACEKEYEDKDYQIALEQFNENLTGGAYKSLRYRVNHAKRCGYSLAIERALTPAHINIMAHHLAKSKSYEFWDYELYLGLGQYISRFDSPLLFSVFADGLLIGFDVVDFLSDVMAVPLGFYLDYPSVADFLIYEEILYGKNKRFKWLDIGWACNEPGLEEFKVKWKAVPRFRVFMQVFTKPLLTRLS